MTGSRSDSSATRPDPPYVAVVGSSEPDPATQAVAHDVGRALARRGAVLVSGGLSGVMEASCRGARSEGGTTVGILPGLDRSEANRHLDVAITTGIGEARNTLI